MITRATTCFSSSRFNNVGDSNCGYKDRQKTIRSIFRSNHFVKKQSQKELNNSNDTYSDQPLLEIASAYSQLCKGRFAPFVILYAMPQVKREINVQSLNLASRWRTFIAHDRYDNGYISSAATSQPPTTNTHWITGSYMHVLPLASNFYLCP